MTDEPERRETNRGATDDRVARAVARVENDGRDGYERDEAPAVPADVLADDPVADALDAYRPDDEDEDGDLVTDGGTDVDVVGLVHLPSTTAVAMWAHPLPAFEDYDEATLAAREVAVDYVERVLDREQGVDRGDGIETDGGEPIRPDDEDDGLRVTCAECWFAEGVDTEDGLPAENDVPETCPECGGDVELVTFDGGRDLSRYEDGVVEFRTAIGFLAHARVVLAPDPDGPDDRPVLARLIGPVRPAEQPDDPTPYGQDSFAPHAEQFAGEAVNAGDELVNLSAPGRGSVQVVAESDVWAAGRYALESADREAWAEAEFGRLAYVHVCETCGDAYRDESEPVIRRAVSRCPACEVDRGEGVETDGGRNVEAVTCLACGHEFESARRPPLGPTCPACGHPARDPKLLRADGGEDAEQVVAFAVKRGEVFAYHGPDTTEFPVRFEGLTTDGVFRVDNPAHRLTSELAGVDYFVRPIGSAEGEVLTDLADDLDGLRDTDAILDVVDDYLAAHGEDGDPDVATDGGRDVPGCVLCGVTAEAGAGLLSVDADAVPFEAREANDGLDRLDRAPPGTVWVCRGCYDDGLAASAAGRVDTSLRRRSDEALQARLDGLRDVQALAARRGNDALYRRATARKEAIRRELCERQVARHRRDRADGRDRAGSV